MSNKHAVRPIELIKPSFYYMLVCYYGAILGYGITSGILGVLAIEATVSRGYAFAWALILAGGAALAGAGVVFSWMRRSPWLELVGTILITSQLFGYSVAIIFYASSQSHSARYSAVWLPIIMAILPIYRIAVMAVDGSLSRKPIKK